MKLSCNVTRDLLPLYHDGVCCEESGRLVEEHIKDCADCRAILKELRGEIEVPREEPDDLAPLERIGKNVKKGKKKAWLRGAAAVLAAVIVIVAGANIWWYADTYSYYQQFAEGRELFNAEWADNEYRWTEGGYEFFVTVPKYPSDSNQLFVHETEKPETRNITPGQQVHTWLNIGHNDFAYLVGLEILTRTQVSGQAHLKSESETIYLELDQDLNLIFPDYLDEEDIAHQKQIMEDHHLEIMRIIQAAQSQWPFLGK